MEQSVCVCVCLYEGITEKEAQGGYSGERLEKNERWRESEIENERGNERKVGRK